MIKRKFVKTLESRFSSNCTKIQIILGPRQVGKTTGVLQFIDARNDGLYFSADSVLGDWGHWLANCFHQATLEGKILVIDEVQKIPNWSEKIKELWDIEAIKNSEFQCILLGSSSLEIHKGLTESLLGRYELILVPHWSFKESNELTGLSFDDFLVYGGYPGSYEYKDDFPRWRDYIASSIVNNVISKDILMYRTVKNPALFKQAFEILSFYPSSEISYNKLLGQIQEKGNIDLVKYYLELYEGAFLMRVLKKFSVKPLKRKTSSPKILHSCPAFYGRLMGPRILSEPDIKGHAFETVVGNLLSEEFNDLYYWREGDYEVDFVISEFGKTVGVEVKSGRKKSSKSRNQFLKNFPDASYYWVDMKQYELFSSDIRKYLDLGV
jgi:predicted AAA+ superfamily ATPase